MRNDQGHFVDVTDSSGIYSSPIGYGLDLSIGDLNLDGYPDIYIGNDFHENDYVYINQKDGTFKEVIEESMQHTSRFSMGVDIGDVNNDGLLDLMSLDMLPNDPVILKSSAAEDQYNTYHFKLSYGYNHQFSRNALQLNQGNLTFSEIGLFSEVHATDWSWSTLLADFDLDGYQDIFISNGIKRRPNDLDYIKYISSDEAKLQLTGNLDEKDLELIKKMPVMKLPNYLYQNKGGVTFQNKAPAWGLDTPSFSSGAIYADLDADGDLDLITNNTDDPAFIYKNLSRERTKNHYLKIRCQGDGANTQGIGARIITNTHHGKIHREMFTSRGFQSSVPAEMILGLGKDSLLASLTVVWPDHRFQTLTNIKADQLLELNQKDAKGTYEFKPWTFDTPLLEDISPQFALDYTHQENKFIEFNREPLIPHMVSTEGPALAVGDINGDGKDDFYIGGAKHPPGQLFFQEDGGFVANFPKAFALDKVSEDVDAAFFDADQDGDLDLLVLSGGNEFKGDAPQIQPRLYLNSGTGDFTRSQRAFEGIHLNGGALAIADYDGDGDQDVLLGARSVPWQYGMSPKSYLMQNDGQGIFTPLDAPALATIGLVTDAAWGDLDGNGTLDLVLVGDWMQVEVFMNKKGELQRESIPESAGLWNSLKLEDMDGDGRLDIIAGNLGLNSKLKASIDHPLKLYVADFDGNKTVDQLLYHWYKGEERLFMTKDELSQQLIEIKKKYVGYQEFAEASASEVISKKRLSEATYRYAEELRTCWFKNTNTGFVKNPLADQAQFAPVWSIFTEDFNQDGQKDLYLGGNLYEINIQMGRYDAGLGSLLLASEEGSFTPQPYSRVGAFLKGQVRDMQKITIGTEEVILVARNNAPLLFLRLQERNLLK